MPLTDLPADFVASNQPDPDWLAGLPGLLGRLAERWELAIGPHFAGIRINYVAPATRADGTRCVLKVSRHVDETRNEIAALRLWEGVGAARLLAADPDSGALLTERLDPGSTLVAVSDADDVAATAIAADVVARLWRPVPDPAASGLRTLSSWCVAFDCNREALASGAGGFPATLFHRVDALRHELLTTTEEPVSLHGDLHHYNVLRGRAGQWLAIDPKGLVGDRCFDVCQFLRNPHRVSPQTNRDRLGIFCAELGLDRARVGAWCVVHAMLDACWEYEDGNDWRPAVAWVEEAMSF